MKTSLRPNQKTAPCAPKTHKNENAERR